mmetsp:Transcript_44261/g.49368  ORF Transcript_44261/g.49368 Transcript_44261/m.49368 type:complete len:107 (-) Transcript_44261:38-358(-)
MCHVRECGVAHSWSEDGIHGRVLVILILEQHPHPHGSPTVDRIPSSFVVMMIIDCSCWCWCWLLFVLIFVVFLYSSLPWGISDEHTVVRPLLFSTLRLVCLVRIFE